MSLIMRYLFEDMLTNMNQITAPVRGLAPLIVGLVILTACGDKDTQRTYEADASQRPEVSETDKGPWGDPIEGMRCRIVYVESRPKSGERQWFYIWTEVQNTTEEDKTLFLGIMKDSERNTTLEDGEGFRVDCFYPNDSDAWSDTFGSVSKLPYGEAIPPGESVEFISSAGFPDLDYPESLRFRTVIYRYGLESGDYILPKSNE